MLSNIQSLRNDLEQRKGKKMQIEKTINLLIKKAREREKDLRRHEQAREIIREVGLLIQKNLQFHISGITSLALGAIFEEPYQLAAEFVQRRNKTECDLYFVRDNYRIDPLSASGGGTVDVAAFSLRIASWAMKYPRSRNTIILDEPLRFLSSEHQEKAGLMIKEVSEKLNLQFIIVTHNQILSSYADKSFYVSIDRGISKVSEHPLP